MPWMQEAKKMNVSNFIQFDGTLPSGQKVYDWLDEVDIYLQPSFQEGLPRALIEAMSRPLKPDVETHFDIVVTPKNSGIFNVYVKSIGIPHSSDVSHYPFSGVLDHQNEHVQSNEDKSVNFRRNSENSQNLNSRLFNMSESSPGPSKSRWSHNQPSTSKPKNGWDHQPLLPQQSKQRPNFQAKNISK